MTAKWDDFIRAIGASELSYEFSSIIRRVGETPVIDMGPLGDRRYYSFNRSGILFIVEDGVLVQVSFYLEMKEGFSVFAADLLGRAGSVETESELRSLLGSPYEEGGGKEDALLGRIPRWLKYDIGPVYLHAEVSLDSKIGMISLLQKR